MKSRIFFTAVFGLFLSTFAYSQVPYINNFFPTSGEIKEVITITGGNLPTSNGSVFFGGIQSTEITYVSANMIQAEVPIGATFDQITVFDDSGNMAYSSSKFTPTFAGSSQTASSVAFSSQVTLPSSNLGLRTNDICACDFDNDEDIDFIVTNAQNQFLTVFENNSTVGNVSFVTSSLNLSGQSVNNVICEDLNGDGAADLVLNKINPTGVGELFFLQNQNNGNIEFGGRQSLQLPNNSQGFSEATIMAIGDIDLDGKPEIIGIISNENYLFIYENISTSSEISFNSNPLQFTATDPVEIPGFRSVHVADLNNDSRLDIIASNYDSNGFYVFENNSIIGNVNLAAPQLISTNGDVLLINSADLDNDGFSDIVLTNSSIETNDYVEILKNTTSTEGNTISFGSPLLINNMPKTWGVDFGDLDGDNDLDIVVATYGSDEIFVLMNTDNENLTFELATLSTSDGNTKHVSVTDVDGDGRVDLAYVNDSRSNARGDVGIMLNENCYAPIISPTDLTICAGGNSEISASATGLSYQWMLNSSDIASANDQTLAVSSAGQYQVKIQDGCETASAGIDVTVSTDDFSQPTINPVADFCEGEDVVISANAHPSTTQYVWNLPDGSQTAPSASPNLPIDNFDAADVGNYSVTASSANCSSTSDNESIADQQAPKVAIFNNASNFFCQGNSINLSTSVITGYDYEWVVDDVRTGQTDPSSFTYSNTLTTPDVNDTETHRVQVEIDQGGCTNLSESIIVQAITAPTSSFTASQLTTCENTEISFTATSTNPFDDFTIYHEWAFGDGNTETGDNVTHSYSTANTYAANVTTKYSDIDNCTYVASADQTITITAAPNETILSGNSDNSFSKCPENQLILSLANTYQSYEWVFINTSAEETVISTNPTSAVTAEGDVFVRLLNDENCNFSSNTVAISDLVSNALSFSSATNTIEDDNGDDVIILDNSQSTVDLSVSGVATSSINDINWLTSNPSILTIDSNTPDAVTVTPQAFTEVITVEADDINSCQTQDTIFIRRPGLIASVGFSPFNGDNINDCWQVGNISSTNCEVVVFDVKGRRIKEVTFNGSNDGNDCVWDGRSSNGTQLPAGVYYYYLKCPESIEKQSGSILLAD